MVNNPLDKQIRALAKLRSLKAFLENARTPEAIEGGHVDTYADALRLLSESGEDVSDFDFPSTGRWVGSFGEDYASRDLLLSSVLSLTEYFAIRASVMQTAEELEEEPARLIGFQQPR